MATRMPSNSNIMPNESSACVAVVAIEPDVSNWT